MRLRLVCQDLGPTFIKFGQILSTRPDLIPPDVANELKNLQDNIPPFSFVHVKEQIESELGKPLSELFETFEEAPLGTASIGQVHAARLKDPTVGSVEDVVVKIQRPQIRGTIESDIDLMRLLAKSLEKRVKQLKTLDLTGILQEFELAIIKELDYSHERRNGTRFYAAFTGNPDVVIPRVYRSHSAKKVLTMQRIKGVKISDAETVGADRRVLARVALRAVLQMVFQNGFFHADPHPGNIFALAGNRVAFLDLGMVGRLSDEMRLHLSDLFIALMQRDTDEIARILCVMGIRQGRVNRASLQRDVIDIMDKVIGVPLEEIQFSEIVKDLMESARRHQIKIPNEYTLMGKALLTVEGVGKNLDPTIDVEAEITPYIRGLIKDR
ncbi:MAG TPA: AarF/ABC1/UbiB kinase family protein, partial [Candidatus Ozemobacteraceae bacterium]|nr:AarF/ABC1/UbiB kinase family protein [Candidatus Ozemobacteraceae bacterium]